MNRTPSSVNRSRRAFLTSVAGTTAIVVAGCVGDGDDGDDGDDTDDEDDDVRLAEDTYEGDFNQVDVQFLIEMIHHHEQAIEMAELVPDRSDREELLDLAAAVEDVQRAEIEQMEDWLREAGVDPEVHADHDHDDMEGMLSDEEMAELEAMTGHEFDVAFVEGMIYHHEGAIEMTELVFEYAGDDRVVELAGEVVEVQEAEIDEMQRWLEEWSEDDY